MINPSNQIHSVLSAANFAAQRLSAQKRNGDAGEPYVNHLIEVAELVSSVVQEADTNVVIAALLHDTVEDVGVSEAELAERFGEDVVKLVAEVSDDKTLAKLVRKQLQIEHASNLSIGAQTIKLADKISNLRSLLSSAPADWDFARRRDYFISLPSG